MILIFLWDKDIEDYIYYKANLDNLPFDTMINAMLRFQQEEPEKIKDLDVMKEDENYERILLKNYSKESVKIVTHYINKGELLIGEDISYNVFYIRDILKGKRESTTYDVNNNVIMEVMSLLAYPVYLDTDYIKVDLERKWSIYSKDTDLTIIDIISNNYIDADLYEYLSSYKFYQYNIKIPIPLRIIGTKQLYNGFGFNIGTSMLSIYNLFDESNPLMYDDLFNNPPNWIGREAKIYEFQYAGYDVIYAILEKYPPFYSRRITLSILINEDYDDKDILERLEIPSIFKVEQFSKTIRLTSDFLYCITRGIIIHDYNVSNVSDLYYLLMLELQENNSNIINHIGIEKDVKRDINYINLSEWNNRIPQILR